MANFNDIKNIVDAINKQKEEEDASIMQGSMPEQPRDQLRAQMDFQENPEPSMRESIDNEIRDIATEGIRNEGVSKLQERRMDLADALGKQVNRYSDEDLKKAQERARYKQIIGAISTLGEGIGRAYGLRGGVDIGRGKIGENILKTAYDEVDKIEKGIDEDAKTNQERAIEKYKQMIANMEKQETKDREYRDRMAMGQLYKKKLNELDPNYEMPETATPESLKTEYESKIADLIRETDKRQKDREFERKSKQTDINMMNAQTQKEYRDVLMQLKELELNKEKIDQDVYSDKATRLRNKLEELNPDITPYTLSGMAPYELQEEIDRFTKTTQKSVKDTREERLKLKDQVNAARNFLKDDPRYKKEIEKMSTYEEIGSLIDAVENEDNQAALAALGTKMARGMGEVGVLTDADVIRYLGSRSWGRKIQEWYDGGMKGTLPPDSIKELKKNMKFFREKTNREVSEIYNNAESRLVSALGVTPERARELIGPRPFGESSNTESGKVRVRNTQTGQVGFIPKENLKKAIESGKYEEVK